jgi:hypothetical protein
LKAVEIRKLEVLLANKQKKSKSALKDLAQAKTKREKLLDLLNKRGLEVVQLKVGKTGAVTEVNLLKKLHKTELKSKKELSKKEIQAKSITIKRLEATKKTLKQNFNKLKRQHETLACTPILWSVTLSSMPPMWLCSMSRPKCSLCQRAKQEK